MRRYPQIAWSPVRALAALAATAVTLAVAVMLPAKLDAQPGVDAVLAQREARPAEVTVVVERVDVVAAQRAPAIERPARLVPTALIATKQPG